MKSSLFREAYGTNSLVLVIILLIVSCSDVTEQENREFAERFREEVNSITSRGADSVLRIDGLTSFEWDSLFIFKPYTAIADVESQIGFKWSDAETTLINQSDDFNLLVFIADRKVVAFSRVPRNYGDFSKLESRGPFTVQNSRFKVKNELVGDQPWVFLYVTD